MKINLNLTLIALIIALMVTFEYIYRNQLNMAIWPFIALIWIFKCYVMEDKYENSK